jgi:glycosyltransferase involved in cell wall biosynthesis
VAVEFSGGPELSVIVPVHNEEANVRPLYTAIRGAMEPLGRTFEVVLVNDGSADRTGDYLDELAARDPRLRPIHLDGNFGEAAALSAGFSCARGRILLTLDGDLQNDPADLPRLLAHLETGGYRAVSGWRRRRQEAFSTRVLPSLVANRMIAMVTGVPSRDNGCGLKAYRREVVAGVCLPHGLHRFMPAVFGVRAAEFGQIEVEDRRRQAGRSHYGLSRFFAVMRDVLLIPYLLRLRDPARARTWLWAAAAAGALLLLTGLAMLLSPGGTPTAKYSLAVLGLLLSAYGNSVRRNLERWLRAQRDRTYRIRNVGAGLSAGGSGAQTPVKSGAEERLAV